MPKGLNLNLVGSKLCGDRRYAVTIYDLDFLRTIDVHALLLKLGQRLGLGPGSLKTIGNDKEIAVTFVGSIP